MCSWSTEDVSAILFAQFKEISAAAKTISRGAATSSYRSMQLSMIHNELTGYDLFGRRLGHCVQP